MSDVRPAEMAIAVDRVSKQFDLPREQVHTLKERFLHPLRSAQTDTLHALRDVSFDVRKGEFFGIAGRNGSGKSTLLKCVAGIYGSTVGDIYVKGQVSTFIELGVGFNPDLPATDNIRLNATMLGLSPKDSRLRIDSVLDFAELREFADLKLKNYSSGMMVRLAFSVMIQVDAEVLIIDEVLAVGDAAFQQKCYDEFERIRRSGKTVLFVTHDMGAIRRFCDRAVLLEKGRLIAEGNPQDVGLRYLQLNFSEEARATERAAAEEQMQTAAHAVASGQAPPPAEPIVLSESEEVVLGEGGVDITESWFEDEDGAPQLTLNSNQVYAFAMRVKFTKDIENPLFAVSMTNSAWQQLFGAASVWTDPTPGLFPAGEEIVWRAWFQNILGPDRYEVSCAVSLAGGRHLQFRERMFSIVSATLRPTGSIVDLPYRLELQRHGTTQQVAS
ncbi:MAG TPA: ABC transporter ATP-binding protein [Baekduia sp.]|uniref:ABC transporter ATP-binding protein n=1 Tax=Baekduia sp. TaxID=2600305 RepID=UPI002B9D247D|nr:ABC transporter ATP-binding protein [Baekduia sp.]HMJ36426.1 ABC transporter ATP-binding protein [Baekduia sp.]